MRAVELRTISCLFEAMSWVAMTGEDHDFVCSVLQTDSGVDD